MTRSIAALAVALGCSCVIGLGAQDTKTTTETKTEGAKAQSVTYTGCMQTGTETKSVILAKVQPVGSSTETAVGTSGVTQTTTTTYALVPEEKVDLQTHVGHKVEVTGMMIPAGDEDQDRNEDRARRRTGYEVKGNSEVRQRAAAISRRVDQGYERELSVSFAEVKDPRAKIQDPSSN
jgi:hypothetical protein